MDKIYIVMQSSGSWDDYIEQPIRAYIDESEALDYVDDNTDKWVVELDIEDYDILNRKINPMKSIKTSSIPMKSKHNTRIKNGKDKN